MSELFDMKAEEMPKVTEFKEDFSNIAVLRISPHSKSSQEENPLFKPFEIYTDRGGCYEEG